MEKWDEVANMIFKEDIEQPDVLIAKLSSYFNNITHNYSHIQR